MASQAKLDSIIAVLKDKSYYVAFLIIIIVSILAVKFFKIKLWKK